MRWATVNSIRSRIQISRQFRLFHARTNDVCSDRGMNAAPKNSSLMSDVGYIEKKKEQKKLLREKIKKTLLGIEKLGGLFRITDVPGDGNCLYNALVKCPDIRFSCPLKFRKYLF